MVIIFIRFFERHRCIEDSRFERGRKIHRWVSQRESLKIGERKERGHNFMPHFSAGKSLRGSHKSFAVWGRRAAPRSSSRRRLFSSGSVLSPLHFTSHHSRLKEFLPSPRNAPRRQRRRRQGHEIYERTKSKLRETPAKSSLPFLLPSLLPSSLPFGSGLLSGQTTSMNRKNGEAGGKSFSILETSLFCRAECRQSEIRAENKGNKKSKEKERQY